MDGGPTIKIRLVRCPRCFSVLPEAPDVLVYACGGCGMSLKAKGESSWRNLSEERVQSLSDEVDGLVRTSVNQNLELDSIVEIEKDSSVSMDGSTPPATKHMDEGSGMLDSSYQGVTFNRTTGRWEAHIWDKGLQFYLGEFDTDYDAARGYDRAAINFKGVDAYTNFALSDYEEDIRQMKNLLGEDVVEILLRRHSPDFPRHRSRYHAMTLRKDIHNQNLEEDSDEDIENQNLEQNSVGDNENQNLEQNSVGDIEEYSSPPMNGITRPATKHMERIEWLLLSTGLILEVTSAIFEQLKYAFLGMVMAFLGLMLCMLEFISKAQKEGATFEWRRRSLPWIYSRHELFGTTIEYFGLVAGLWQSFDSTFGYFYTHHKKQNPIQMSVIPILFCLCKLVGKLVKRHYSRMGPRRESDP